MEVVEGKEVTLSCAASGGPGLTLSWHHNGVNITHSGKYKIINTTEDRTVTSILTISRLVKRTDSGIITCTAMITVYLENPQLPNVTPVTLSNSSFTYLSVAGKHG